MIHSAQSINKLLELISKISKSAGNKISTQKSIVFLITKKIIIRKLNSKLETIYNNIKKNTNCLGIILTKDV